MNDMNIMKKVAKILRDLDDPDALTRIAELVRLLCCLNPSDMHEMIWILHKVATLADREAGDATDRLAAYYMNQLSIDDSQYL